MSTTLEVYDVNSYTDNNAACLEDGIDLDTSVMLSEEIASWRVASFETSVPASFSNGTSEGLEIVSQIFEDSCENEMNVAKRKATVSGKDLKVYISVRFVVCLFCWHKSAILYAPLKQKQAKQIQNTDGHYTPTM